MNREIKFKAWDTVDKKWIYGGKPFCQCYLGNITNIGQFTGLKDKNGKEIYEGDIVKNFDYRACEVLFQNGAYGYETEHVGFVSFAENESFNWKNNQSKYLEVIGNIYDNPSLLGNDNAD